MPYAVATALTAFRWILPLAAAAMLSTVHGKGLIGNIDAIVATKHVPKTPIRIQAVQSASPEATSTFGDSPRKDSREAVYVASSDGKWGAGECTQSEVTWKFKTWGDNELCMVYSLH